MVLRSLSLGAGVQSTTLALMIARGDLPMVDCAVFADTGWEPKSVYEHLDRLKSALPFPVHIVSAGNIREHALRKTNIAGGRFASIPWFTSGGGMGRRQCTREFKIEPIAKKHRELLGYKPRQRIPPGSVEVLIGISTDEAIRMKPAWKPWQTNRWPLIEKGMSRNDCLNWLTAHQWSAPKSSCIGCPFHSDHQWRDLRDNDQQEWNDAVAVDRALRAAGPVRGMRQLEYMHRSLKPLDQVDLSTAEERGQLNLFLNECEGMCGN